MPTKKVSPKKKAAKKVAKKTTAKRIPSNSNHFLQPPPFEPLQKLPILADPSIAILEEVHQMRLEQKRLLNEQILFTMAATLWIMALTLTVSKISRRLAYL